MRGLRVLLLGRPVLEIDGQPLTRLMAAKQQALVFHLAAERRPVSRGRLAAMLWSDLDEAAARANLRVALTRLRRWLPGQLDIDAQQVGFGEPPATDLHALESAAAEPAGVAAGSLVATADAYRGPLLDGLDLAGADGFEHWLRPLRERARRFAVELRQHLATRLEADGDLAAAIVHARAWLDIDETDESGHATLMRLLAACRQRTAAIAQYETCRAILGAQLGARPSADTYALYCRIHADAPTPPAATALAPPAVTPAAFDARVGDDASPAMLAEQPFDPLIGREADLGAIAERLLDPACRLLTLVGPGGVGKTRLAQAAAQTLHASFPGGIAFASGRDLGAGAVGARALADALAERLGAERTRSGAVGRAIAHRLGGRAALGVLDNVETVPDVRALATQLIEAAPSLTLLATSRLRLGGAREWLFEVRGLALERDAPSMPASSAAARLFVRQARRLDARFETGTQADAIERICAHVAGLPLALELAARGALLSDCASIAARIEAGAPLEDPTRDWHDRHRSVDAVLLDSWSLLDLELQSAACGLAALPAPFDAALAAAAAGVDAAALDRLREHSWLARSDDGRLAMHPLQREFVQRRPEHDAALRRDIDEALARHVRAVLAPAPPFAEVGSAAGAALDDFSAAALHRVTTHAQAHWELHDWSAFVDMLCSHLVAARRSQEALALLETAAQAPALPRWRSAAWSLRRAELLNELGDVPHATLAYQRGFELLGVRGFDSNDVSWRAATASALGIVRARDWPAERELRDGFAHLLCRSLSFASKLMMFTTRTQPMLVAGTLGTVVAGRWLAPPEIAGSFAGAAYTAALLGHARLGAWIGRRVLPKCAPPAQDRLAAVTHQGVAAQQASNGQWDGLVARLDEIARAFLDLHCVRHHLECRSLAAKVSAYQGRLHAAHERFVAMTADASALGGALGAHWGLFGMVETGLRIGCYDDVELQSLLEQARRDMTEMEIVDSAYTMRWLGLKALLEWRLGRGDDALETALTGVSAARRIHHCGFWAHEGFAGVAEVLLRWRARERAQGGSAAAIEPALASAMQAMRAHVRRFPPAASRWRQLQGLAALDERRTAPALAALRDAVRVAERYGMRHELARSCEWLAHADAAQRERWRDRAERLYADSGAHVDLRRLRADVVAARGAPSEQTPARAA